MSDIADALRAYVSRLRNELAEAEQALATCQKIFGATPAAPAPEPPAPISRVGRGRKDAWTPEEVAVLREHYPAGGTAACAAHLPGRSLHCIRIKAQKVDVRSNGPRGRPRKAAIDAPAAPPPEPAQQKIVREPRTFEETLALVASGKARIIEKPRMPSRQYDQTLGGVTGMAI